VCASLSFSIDPTRRRLSAAVLAWQAALALAPPQRLDNAEEEGGGHDHASMAFRLALALKKLTRLAEVILALSFPSQR
jgi:hypothetical protein